MSLIEVVKTFCAWATRDRDDSHGYNHMAGVAKLTAEFAAQSHMSAKDTTLAVYCAWLHDVADHKYKFPVHKVQHFLFSIMEPEDANLACNIIERVSFSREEKMGTGDWKDTLGDRGTLIRDIVSDADKLHALGSIGFDRCVDYTRHKWGEENKTAGSKMPPDLLKERVLQHCNDKLFNLKTKFRTVAGRAVAEKATDDLVALVKAMPDLKK